MEKGYEEVKCAVCNADDTELISKRGQFNIPLNVVLCKACGLGYLNPRWNEKTYFKFYSTEYDSYYRPSLISDIDTKSPESNTIYKRLLKHDLVPENVESILDIGSGAGENLLNFQKLFPNAKLEAIEPSEEAKLHLEKKEIKVISSDANSDWHLKNENKYCIIILRHVLEHLLEPRNILSKIRKALNHDGVLYIAVPNNLNPKQNLHTFWYRVVHTYYFNKFSLFNMLAIEKLKVIFLNEGDELGPHELIAVVKKSNSTILPQISKDHFNIQKQAFSERLKIDNKIVNKLKRVVQSWIK